MDFSYILFNTLVYGGLALVFSTFYAYSKIQHLGIGAFMVFLGYVIYQFVMVGFDWMTVLVGLGCILFYLGTNRLLIRFFSHEESRELLSIVFTLGMSMILENSINMMYGPSSVSISGMEVTLPILILLFIVLNGVVFYIFGSTMFGKMMKGIFERSQVVSSLGIRVSHIQYSLFFILLVILGLVASLVLIESNMRSTDGLFYLIKGIGVSILVGFSQKQRVFIGAMVYVLLEYFLFIYMGVPIMYKESLILLLILFVLIWKPSGLFSFGKRRL